MTFFPAANKMEKKDRRILAKSRKHWANKTVIGLTGNIGAGKSAVLRMLEYLGALGIDADRISHQIIAKKAAGYQPVVDHFGAQILSADGEIDRARLGRIVFADPRKLKALEEIIHPRVTEAVDVLMKISPQPVAVLEAIKLLESGLAEHCDSVWVVKASPETQLKRLMTQRNMSQADALQRIEAQSPQELKISRADVVIDNSGSLEETWRQVQAAWLVLFPGQKAKDQPVWTASCTEIKG